MESYFFVPANQQKFIDKSKDIAADYIVYDLEDSVADADIETALEHLSKIDIQPNMYVRPRFYKEADILDKSLLQRLIGMGFSRFLLPKFTKGKVEKIAALLSDHFPEKKLDFIILVESPLGLLHLSDVLESKILPISGVGLGSHDYCNAMDMEHTLDNLYFARQSILNSAKAFGLKCLDIVAVNLNDDESFLKEVKNGFSMGFDAKFLIHPKQLALVNNFQFYSPEEIQEAEAAYPHILDIVENRKSLVKVNGKMYEKPHVNRILKIIHFQKRKHGSK